MGRGKRGEQDKHWGLRGTNYWVKSKLQGYVVQHGEYREYFLITVNDYNL